MRIGVSVATIVATVTLGGSPLGETLGAQQSSDSAASRQQRSLDSLSAALRAMERRVDSLQGAQAPAAGARPRAAYMNVSFVGLTNFGWSSTPDVGSLQLGDHDPKVRGFTIPNAELVFDGAVDPYFKAFAAIVSKIDEGGETGVELEEMYLLSTALPKNLQLKVGQFFTEFGRQNQQHPHAWGFADQPLVLGRMFGPDGLRSQGARLSWLLPTSWYSEAMLGVINSAGGTTFSFRSDESSEIHGGAFVDRPVENAADMLYVPRITTSFEPTDNQVWLVGASGALGPNNSGAKARTSIYGADVYWKWKSSYANQGFPFVSFQGEYMHRTYDAASRAAADAPTGPLPAESLRDDGMYAQLLWGIKPRVVAGARAEYVSANAGAFTTTAERADRSRFSPNLTWYPSEYSKVRFQYNLDHRASLGNDHSVWIQVEFLLGAHAAHKF